jgi:hypothetical protein
MSRTVERTPSAIAWWDAVPAALDGEQQQGG